MAISKNTIKFVKSLHLKKFRLKYDIFVAEGDKIAREMLMQSALAIDHVFALEAWAITHAGLLQSRKDVEITVVTEKELAQLSALTTPNQVLVLAQIPEFVWPETSSFTKALYLDGIQDPGNMGTLLRIADWFGISYVFCAGNCVDIYNGKVIQASMGAFLRVRTTEIELADLLDRYKVPVLGAFMDADNAFEVKWPEKGILVIGSEGEGINQQHFPLITQRVTILKGAGSGAESLNAAVAAGVLCAVWGQRL